jgi:hypothetical protein
MKRMVRHRRPSFVVASLLACLAATAGAADPWDALTDAMAKPDAAARRTALEAILTDHPGFQAAHFNLGTVLMDGDAEAAARHFESACAATEPDLAADARFNLALLRYRQGRLKEAVADAEAALKLRPAHADSKALCDELRRVWLARQDEARRKAEEDAKKLGFANQPLPEGIVGEPYDAKVPAKGGAGGYRFSLGAKPAAPAATPAAAPQAGTPLQPQTPPASEPAEPPPGLTLDADGRLHGTPTKPGSFTVPVVVEDTAKDRATGSITVTIVPPPRITTTELPEAVQDIGYLAQLSCTGLVDPVWTVDGLPEGLALTPAKGATVTISGTPRTSGKLDLRVQAHDAKRRAASALPLAIDPYFAPDARRLPPATAWAPYQNKVGIRGPVQRYAWKTTPTGGVSSLDDGTFTGTPDKAGDISIPVSITAADGHARDVTMALTVNPPPVIEQSEPVNLTQGQAANHPLKVEGGTPPYHWRVAEGVLPKGLRLDADGALRGVASDPGDSEITVALDDRWKATTQQKVKLHIAPNENPPPEQDQKNQQQQAQQGQQGQSGQQQDQSKQDQSQADQAKQDQQKSGDQKQDQKSGEQKQDGKQDGQQDAAAQRAAAEKKDAENLDRAATDRWLEQLPRENGDVLRYQLLEGGENKPQKKGKTW